MCGLVARERRRVVGRVAASASARVWAPAIARLEPSPKRDTQDAASPSSVTRPRDQDGSADLADRVEVQVVGRPQPLQQLRHAPAGARVRLGDDPLVLGGVAVVEAGDRRAAEDEGGQRPPRDGWIETRRPGVLCMSTSCGSSAGPPSGMVAT